MIGSSLGPYRVIEQLGAGGMGEVYLGEDTRLGRKVAIKVLPTESANDPERLVRFEREARAAAALNHPHIAVIHDIGVEGDTHFIVQEYLEGETLRAPLQKGALPLRRVLSLGAEIADALGAAHSVGVIHRDIKPENIFVTPEGHAKVLDFGLAKLTEHVPERSGASHESGSPTVIGTVAGKVLGTAGYMAPEQVEAEEEVDERADLFALGAVLYELASGHRAFSGESVIQTLNNIVHEEPRPLEEGAHPAELRRILRKALVKDRQARYQTARDLAIDLRALEVEELAGSARLSSRPETRPDTGRASGAAMSWKLLIPAAVALVIGTAAITWTLLKPGPPDVNRWVVDLPTRLAADPRGGVQLTVSPDGQRIVWVAAEGDTTHLYQRPVGRFTSTLIPGTAGARRPFFSPDGRGVGFATDGALMTVDLEGNEPHTVCNGCATTQTDASWSPGGEAIVFTNDRSLWRVAAIGGTPELVVSAGDHDLNAFGRPDFLPGGEALLLEARATALARSYRIALFDLLSDELTVLDQVGTDPVYVDTGHILYANGNRLFALPFDPAARASRGEAVPVLENMRVLGNTAQVAVSSGGTLAFLPGQANTDVDRSLVWVDREGNEESVVAVIAGLGSARLSPDGQQVAVVVDARVWVYDLGSETLRILPQPDVRNSSPVWIGGGAEVVFASGEEALRTVYRVAVDGSEAPELILRSDNPVTPTAWSASANELILYEIDAVDQRNVVILPLTDGGELRPFRNTAADEKGAVLSPDDRWLAYVSDESGREEIWVEPFSGGGARTLVSDLGGRAPLWHPRGGELFYYTRTSRQLISVPVRTSPDLGLTGGRQELFDASSYLVDFFTTNYDVASDGQRFLMVKEAVAAQDISGPDRIYVVLNWFEELKERVPRDR